MVSFFTKILNPGTGLGRIAGCSGNAGRGVLHRSRSRVRSDVSRLIADLFFATIGLNAKLSDLIKGGPLLGIMLVLTIGYMFVQNGIGVLGASLFGLPSQAGVMMGTTSLIGGHGTAIAWGPVVEQQYVVAGAAELGIAAATIGLIMASLLGGPIASYLIARDQLAPSADERAAAIAVDKNGAQAEEPSDPTGGPTNPGLMRAILWTHVAIVIGFIADESLELAGANLPLFVPCLISGIVIAKLMPRVFPRI